MLPGMKIRFHLKCRSFRDILVFLFSFSIISLYITYQLGTLTISRSIHQETYVHTWGSQVQVVGDSYFLVQLSHKDDDSANLKDDSKAEVPSARTASIRQQLLSILMKLEMEHLSALKNISKVALIYGQQHIIRRDFPLYQDLLLRHGFTVKVPSSFPFEPSAKRFSKFDGMPASKSLLKDRKILSDWMLMLCLTTLDGDSEACLSKDLYPRLKPFQKINRIFGMRNLLWSPEGLCATLNEARQITVLKRRHISPMCFLLPEQYEQFRSVVDALGEDSAWVVKPLDGKGRVEMLPMMEQRVGNLLQQYNQSHPVMLQQFFPNPLIIFGSPVSLRVYVLITSILPLKAYFFNEGLVNFRHDYHKGFRKVQGQLWTMSQMWHYLARNYGQQMVQTAIRNVQNAIVQTLLFTETKVAVHLASLSSSKSKITYRCKHCFQLLEFEIVFNASLHPIILEVDGHPAMQEQTKEDGWRGDKVKRSLLNSVLVLLFGTDSVAKEVARELELNKNVGIMGIDCLLSHDLCLTNEDLRYLLDARREAASKNGFWQIYPSAEMEQHSLLLSELDRMLQSRKPTAILIDKVLSRFSSRHTTAELHQLLTFLERRYARANGTDAKSFDTWLDTNSQTSSFSSEFLYQNKRPVNGSLTSDFDGRPKCSEDPATLPYVLSIHTEPALNISPSFSPSIMDYFANVSYNQLMVKVWSYALNCQSEARLDEKFGTSQPVNYTLGLGDNRISFVVVDISHTEPWVINTYTLVIHRHSVTENEPNFEADAPHEVCSIKQECEFRVSLSEPCGIQKEAALNWTEFLTLSRTLPFCDSGDASGRWVLPCRSCSQHTTCMWRKSVWAPFLCQYGRIGRENLSRCLDGKKVLFIGDSTNRGIMHYLMERLNGTLKEWDKTHLLKVYTNVNYGRTTVSFAYYPQFWLPTNERPVFEKALYQLVQKSRPLQNDSSTILVVGGVHWLATQHLHMLLRGLRREGLQGIRLMMKTLGSGFHLPVEGVHSLSKLEQRKLLLHSMGLAEFAKHYDFEVIDTFNITIPRYKDFLQGKCACHFHKVVPFELSERGSFIDQQDTEVHRHLPMPWVFGQSGYQWQVEGKGFHYHVEGPVNAAYSEILISRLCHEYQT